jgi:hypothetical protein
MSNSITTYNFIKAHKYILPMDKAHQVETAYKIENEFCRRAVLEEKLKIPERFYPITRRNQLFLAFRAKDYRNPVARRSIIEALKNCSNK